MKCHNCNTEVIQITRELYLDPIGSYLCQDGHYPAFHSVRTQQDIFNDYFNSLPCYSKLKKEKQFGSQIQN